MADGPTYPTGTIAKLLRLTPRRVQQLTAEGVIPKAERGRYELAPAVQGYIDYLNDRLAGKIAGEDGGTGVTWQAERTQKMRADRMASEIELARMRHEVVELSIVKEEVSRAFSAIRTRLLSLGPTLAPQLAAAKTANEARALVDDRVIEALHAISSGVFELAGGTAAGDDSDAHRGRGRKDGAAADADTERVGGREEGTVG